MTKDKALKLALEALEMYQGKSSVQMFDAAITALREALAQPEQEPVACQYAKDVAMFKYRCVGRCQYDTSPPEQRTWVGLTDEEIDTLVIGKDGLPNSHLEFARAIEAAHGIREKNHVAQKTNS